MGNRMPMQWRRWKLYGPISLNCSGNIPFISCISSIYSNLYAVMSEILFTSMTWYSFLRFMYGAWDWCRTLQGRNFALNPNEGLKISPFKNAHTERAAQDRELDRLARYLVHIADIEDFRSINHKVWRCTHLFMSADFCRIGKNYQLRDVLIHWACSDGMHAQCLPLRLLDTLDCACFIFRSPTTSCRIRLLLHGNPLLTGSCAEFDGRYYIWGLGHRILSRSPAPSTTRWKVSSDEGGPEPGGDYHFLGNSYLLAATYLFHLD